MSWIGKVLVVFILNICFVSCLTLTKHKNDKSVTYRNNATGTINTFIEGDVFNTYEANELHDSSFHYITEQNFQKAKYYALRALKIEPNNPTIHNTIAIIYKSQKLFDNAIQSLQLAILNDNKYYRSHTNLGLMYLYKKEYDKAIKILNQIPSENIEKSILRSKYYNLFMVHTLKKDCDSALVYYNKACMFCDNKLVKDNIEGFKRDFFDANCP